MPLDQVIAASTINAATILGRPELGSLKPGSVGDAAVLSIDQGEFVYTDAVGKSLIGKQKLNFKGVVMEGKWWHPI